MDFFSNVLQFQPWNPLIPILGLSDFQFLINEMIKCSNNSAYYVPVIIAYGHDNFNSAKGQLEKLK